MRPIRFAMLLVFAMLSTALAQAPRPSAACGETIVLRAAGDATIGVSLAQPAAASATGSTTTLVLLPGGGGDLDLDGRGCPRALKGNSLVRSIAHFNALGFATALVDAPSTHKGADGLGGYRATAEHARDLALVVAELRGRSRGPVWVIGTSRGTISAMNLAARASGAGAPDGVVITSVLTVGDANARRPWVAQSVFDARLEAVAVPVLLVGHAEDACVRSPAIQMERVARRLAAAPRQQVVVVTGGPGGHGLTGIEACEGRSPHGFLEQERVVAEGIARFVRGGRY